MQFQLHLSLQPVYSMHCLCLTAFEIISGLSCSLSSLVSSPTLSAVVIQTANESITTNSKWQMHAPVMPLLNINLGYDGYRESTWVRVCILLFLAFPRARVKIQVSTFKNWFLFLNIGILEWNNPPSHWHFWQGEHIVKAHLQAVQISYFYFCF